MVVCIRVLRLVEYNLGIKEAPIKSLIRNKSAEKDVRDWLSKNEYIGESAKFTELELHAIQRPGWLQVFRFEISVQTSERRTIQLFGAMRSDERFGRPKIVVYESLAERDAHLAEWSEGLITQRRHRL